MKEKEINRVVRWFAGAAIVTVALSLPFLLKGFLLFQLTMALAYAVALLGLNMVVGYSGQISLGHGAFFAIGAYTTAILMDQFAVPYWAALFAGGIVSFAIGFFFALPALRLQGHYLALATFALAVATPQLLKWQALQDWSGGVQGIFLQKPDAPYGLPLSSDQWLYFFALAVAAFMFWCGKMLLGGQVGRAMIAIRDHPVAASAMGIDVGLTKSKTFAVSALYTGIAGALSAIVVQFVSPDTFNLFLSISLITGVVVGGLGTVTGALYGAVFIQFVPNLTDQLSKAAPAAIYGLIVILVVLLFPRGVAGAVHWLCVKARRRIASRRRLSGGIHWHPVERKESGSGI